MKQPPPLSEKIFCVALQEDLGPHFDRCLVIFLRYQNQFSRRLAEIFCHAAKRERLEEVLEVFERCTCGAEILKHLLIYERSFGHGNPEAERVNPFGVTKLV